MRILHAIHDFLPRHRAGSEIYAAALCRELGARHHVTVVCADYAPARAHGQLTWRMHDGVAVVEITNNWICATFGETYRPPVARLNQVLDIVQPHVLHVHNLLNLSFDLPAAARTRGIPSWPHCTTTRSCAPLADSASIAPNLTYAARSTRRAAPGAFPSRCSTTR